MGSLSFFSWSFWLESLEKMPATLLENLNWGFFLDLEFDLEPPFLMLLDEIETLLTVVAFEAWKVTEFCWFNCPPEDEFL